MKYFILLSLLSISSFAKNKCLIRTHLPEGVIVTSLKECLELAKSKLGTRKEYTENISTYTGVFGGSVNASFKVNHLIDQVKFKFKSEKSVIKGRLKL